MTLQTFLALVRGGEKSNVDFKLQCNAFNRKAGDQEKAKAELVKDICAMANNGASASYLIIGVSDDRKTVQSVSDTNLSSQNIQSLVRDSIQPRPSVRVHRERWHDAPTPLRNVDFVIVQVGPNARHAFRISRDFVNFGLKYHFRKNEVWVRNEDTSDLATPEQIGRLLGMRRLLQADPEPTFPITEYQKLPRNEQINALQADVLALFDEMGTLSAPIAAPDDQLAENYGHIRVCLKIRGKPFLFRCVFLHRLASDMDRHFGLPSSWTCEHGMIIFVLGSFSQAGKFRSLSVDSRFRWGSLGMITPNDSTRYYGNFPRGFAQTSLSVLTLPKLEDTRVVRELVGRLFSELDSDQVLFDHLDKARRTMNKELRRWFRKSPAAVEKAFPQFATESVATFKRQLAAAVRFL